MKKIVSFFTILLSILFGTLLSGCDSNGDSEGSNGDPYIAVNILQCDFTVEYQLFYGIPTADEPTALIIRIFPKGIFTNFKYIINLRNENNAAIKVKYVTNPPKDMDDGYYYELFFVGDDIEYDDITLAEQKSITNVSIVILDGTVLVHKNFKFLNNGNRVLDGGNVYKQNT